METIAERIALNVMGWQILLISTDSTTDATLQAWIDDVGIDHVGTYYIDRARNRFIAVDDWEPEHDIGQAKRVIDRMAELGFWCQIYTTHSSYWAGFGLRTRLYPDWTCAASIESAICLAALAAIARDTK